MNTFEYAKAYAARGWAVLPIFGIRDGACTCGDPDCSSPGKHPMIGGGCKSATTNINLIESWWTDNPDANIGIATGQQSSIIVLDVDTADGKLGNESLALLEAKNGSLPREMTVRTGSGGQHIYFKAPLDRDIRNSASALGENLDIRANGGYVVAPPSRHISGNIYTWETSIEH